MANSKPIPVSAILQNIQVEEGNKITFYALHGAIDMIVRSEAEPFVSQSSIIRGSRPKNVPLASSNYGKIVSSPMGYNITASVNMPKVLFSREELHRQIDALCDQVEKSLGES